jgi:hypothetical protein
LYGETSLTIYVIDGDDRNPAFQEDGYHGLVPEPPLRVSISTDMETKIS